MHPMLATMDPGLAWKCVDALHIGGRELELLDLISWRIPRLSGFDEVYM
jgi:hypothetical protein